jgi:hypothetical protein
MNNSPLHGNPFYNKRICGYITLIGYHDIETLDALTEHELYSHDQCYDVVNGKRVYLSRFRGWDKSLFLLYIMKYSEKILKVEHFKQ